MSVYMYAALAYTAALVVYLLMIRSAIRSLRPHVKQYPAARVLIGVYYLASFIFVSAVAVSLYGIYLRAS